MQKIFFYGNLKKNIIVLIPNAFTTFYLGGQKIDLIKLKDNFYQFEQFYAYL